MKSKCLFFSIPTSSISEIEAVWFVLMVSFSERKEEREREGEREREKERGRKREREGERGGAQMQ